MVQLDPKEIKVSKESLAEKVHLVRMEEWDLQAHLVLLVLRGIL